MTGPRRAAGPPAAQTPQASVGGISFGNSLMVAAAPRLRRAATEARCAQGLSKLPRAGLVVLMAALAGLGGCGRKTTSPARQAASAADAVRPLVGRWDMTVTTPQGERPSWLEVSVSQGQPEGLMVGFWGNATPTGKVQVKDGEIEFAPPQNVGYSEGTTLTAKLVNGALAGTATSPQGATWRWTGERAPSLVRQGAPQWGKPVRLFNGRNLAGWKFADPSHGHVWSVVRGTLVKQGSGSELITDAKFEDFKLHVEFNCGPKSNSGVYLRGRYEVQIETDSAADPPNRRMGAIYGFIAPQPALPRTPDVWQTYDITLVGRTVTVAHDGRTVIDHQEIPGITGGALDSHEGLPGPIYLQGSEEGRVMFRDIVITPAK